ncbi:MAG: sulfatase [Deltaproteobacteria bacterium]|nr:sulfatase [Deltaproteobacteria bacterium]
MTVRRRERLLPSGRRALLVLAGLALCLTACSRRGKAAGGGDATDAGTHGLPPPRATTAGPPAPRIYEQAPASAPDYPKPPGGTEGSQASIPARFREAFPWFGFVNHLAMADIDHHGVFVDFGTPHRFKHTLGNWAMGWSGDYRDGRESFSWAVDDPRDGSPNVNHRLYFFVQRPRGVTMQMRYRSAHRRSLTGNLNGSHGFRRTLEAGDWKVLELELPAEALREGENYLQLYQDRGPAEDLGNRKGYFRVDWVWFRTGKPGEGVEPVLPVDAELLREVALREESGAEATRPSLVLPLPTSVSYYLEIPLGPVDAPTDPFIGFTYGTRAAGAGRASAVTFELGITGEDGLRRVVWSRDVPPEKEGLWRTASSGALGSFGGQVVRVDFSVRGRPVEGFRAVWGAPTLFVSQAPGEARVARTPRNVVLLLIDTQRADHTEPYAVPGLRVRLPWRGGDVQTPLLRALGEEGTVFEAAIAPENWTLPSTASLLTGMFPTTHGAQRERDALSPEVLLLPQFLKQQGFRTAGFVANGHVSAATGFDRGWDLFKNYIKEGVSNRADDVFRDALTWIRANRGSPFFLYLHTVDPHVPYDPPGRYLERYDGASYAGPVQPRDTAALLERVKAGQLVLTERDRVRLQALYKAEATYHDEALKRFWDELGAAGLQDDTLLIVAADHGEEFLEHGKVGHGHSLFQELLHVPLVFRFPGLPAGRRVAEYVSLLDVAPTIVDLLNLGPAADGQNVPFEGNSLLPELLGHRVAGPVAAFATHQGERMAVLAAGWKLVMVGPTQSALFRLVGDERIEELPLLPDGKWDWEALRLVVRDHPIPVRYLRTLLGQFLGASRRRHWSVEGPGAAGAREYAPSAARYEGDLAERLRAMGYLR